MNPQLSAPVIEPEQNTKLTQGRDHPGISVRALILRAIPLIASFFLFVLAAGADVEKFGSRGLQAMLIFATLLGVVGIAVFIPRRNLSR